MIPYPFVSDKIPASFITRINRFVVKIYINGEEHLAYLPNPGRLWELLLPNTKLLVVKNSIHKKIPFTVLFSFKYEKPVLLHTHLTNQIVEKLIQDKKIDFLNDFVVVNKEVKYKDSRFDLLLKNGSYDFFLEIKTCTLFGKDAAMFPDAPSERATRHLIKLNELPDVKTMAGCLFVIMDPDIKYFYPAFHIDPMFSRTLFNLKDNLVIKAVSIGWNKNLTEIATVNDIQIPWNIIGKKLIDSGIYLLIIRMDRDIELKIGGLGIIKFQKGFYVYTGSAKRHLSKRILRHKNKNKQKHWHIDYLLETGIIEKDIPIITKQDLECNLARDLEKISDDYIEKFGASDCNCKSHLNFFKNHPLEKKQFVEILTEYRLDKV